MLSANELASDSRARREATALADAGHDVHVVGWSAESAATAQAHGGVALHAVPRTRAVSVHHFARVLRLHAAVLAFDARRAVVPPGRRQSVTSIGSLAVLPLLALVLAGAKLLRRLSGDRLRVGLQVQEALRYLNDFGASSMRLAESLRPDVVHAHDLVTLSGGAVVAAKAGAELVYDAHELETQTNYHSLSLKAKRWIARYESVLIRRARVVTVCDSIADWLRDEYAVERPLVVLNAPEDRRDAPTRTTVRRTLSLPLEVPLVVYVGSVTVDRGLELSVEALRHLPGVHLATVGWRYLETEQAMRFVAEREGVADRIHFVDPVPSGDVVGFLEDADASVIPIQNVCLSYDFCFPNKLLESVFAGVPVAVSDLVELRRFVTEHRVGVVMDERTPQTIAAALRHLLDRRSEYAPSREKVAELEQRYGWAVQGKRLRDLYESFDDERGRGHERPEPALVPTSR
jgi:glycosyltransferase involved in cell wall biosynthesis